MFRPFFECLDFVGNVSLNNGYVEGSFISFSLNNGYVEGSFITLLEPVGGPVDPKSVVRNLVAPRTAPKIDSVAL